MRHSAIWILASLMFMSAGAGLADEEKVATDQIPSPVMKALQARFPQARIVKCTRAVEGDKLVYDIEFTEAGRKCEADITGRGLYLNFERAVEAKSLPRAVVAAIEKRYPKATLEEIMEEIEVTGRDEKLVAYEVVLRTDEKKEVEVKVSLEGEILEDSQTP